MLSRKVYKVIILFFITCQSVLSADSYLSNPTCSTQNYHQLKNELNLDGVNETYEELKPYISEAFVSYHIYSIDKTRDVGEEFQFGKNHIAKLLKYTEDIDSGFEAGLYLIDNSRYIIAFGGTTSREKYSTNDAYESAKKDAFADAKLLSNDETSYQVNLAAIFLQKLQVDYPDQDITATGHSLGGGLAQFASLMSKQYSQYKKIKAVTFNTAPMPLTDITKNWVENLNTSLTWADLNNVNFMVNNDPLTNVLKSAESYSGSSLRNFYINTGYEELNSFLNGTILGKNLKGSVFSLAQIYLNQTVRDLKKLIYGQRIVLSTNTGHSVLEMIKKVSPVYNKMNEFRHGFDDVKVESSLYCNLLSLMEEHVISYPKATRQYKFYPNNEASIYEVSIFVVNAFFYKEYREALEEEPSLTKFKYFLDYFGIVWYAENTEPITFNFLNNIMQTIFEQKILNCDTYKKIVYVKEIKTEIYNESVSNIQQSIFGFNRLYGSQNTNITRGQLASWVDNGLGIDFDKYVTDIQASVYERWKNTNSPKSVYNYLYTDYQWLIGK